MTLGAGGSVGGRAARAPRPQTCQAGRDPAGARAGSGAAQLQAAGGARTEVGPDRETGPPTSWSHTASPRAGSAAQPRRRRVVRPGPGRPRPPRAPPPGTQGSPSAEPRHVAERRGHAQERLLLLVHGDDERDGKAPTRARGRGPQASGSPPQEGVAGTASSAPRKQSARSARSPAHLGPPGGSSGNVVSGRGAGAGGSGAGEVPGRRHPEPSRRDPETERGTCFLRVLDASLGDLPGPASRARCPALRRRPGPGAAARRPAVRSLRAPLPRGRGRRPLALSAQTPAPIAPRTFQ